MNSFSYVFVIALIAGTGLQYWLAARQARHVREHADRVPAEFAGRIALTDHRKAASYTLARLGVERLDLALAMVIVLAWTLGGGLQLLDQLWQQTRWPPLWQGVGLLLSLLLIGGLIHLPLSLWSTFGIESRFGFNRTTPKRYVLDLGLQLVLSLALGIPLALVLLWLMAGAGQWWWLWAWLVWMAFTLTLTWAYPTLIAPLFNRFEPLKDVELRHRLERLLQRCGFSSRGMFVMDGSKRSAHGNAYFTGFGRNKRIVFFDTLLDGLSGNEIEAVLAHELGHFKKRHILKRLLSTAALSLAGLALLGWLAQQGWFYDGLGVERRTDALALTLFLLALPVFTVFVSPVFAAISRKHEFEADDYAAEQADARALISGLVKMYRDNASTLTPDPLYSSFHHSHPPAPVRIAHLSDRMQPS